jgi:hypothetical protein
MNGKTHDSHPTHQKEARTGRRPSEAEPRPAADLGRLQSAAGNLAIQKRLLTSGSSAADADRPLPAATASSLTDLGTLCGVGLPTAMRGLMENSLGRDLSRVRIHSGHRSATIAASLGAQAVTIGQEILFGEGRYPPRVPSDEYLLAHELAHTVQSTSSSRELDPSAMRVAERDHYLERQARHVAQLVVQGRRVDTGSLERAGTPFHGLIFREDGPSPPPAGQPADSLETLVLPDESGFTDPLLHEAYRNYITKGGTAKPVQWAVLQTSGMPRERLVQLLGPDYAKGRRGPAESSTTIDVSTIQLPPDYTPEQLERDLELLRNRPDLLLARLQRLTEEPITGTEINVGHYGILKGNIGELLALPRKLAVLEEVRRTEPDAELFSGVTARFYRADGTLTDPVAFSDDVIASVRLDGLTIHRVFEIKAGRTGGQGATEQIHRWIEGHATWGMVLNLPGVPRDFHYSDTSRLIRNLTTAPREIIAPEGTEHLGTGSADQVVAPVERTSLGRTPEQIEYLTRLVVEEVAALQQATRLAEQASKNKLQPAQLGSTEELTRGEVAERVERESGGLALAGGQLYRIARRDNSVTIQTVPVQAITVPMAQGARRTEAPPTARPPGGSNASSVGLALAPPTSGGGQARGPIQVPGPVPSGLAQHPNIINFSGQTIILGSRAVPPTPAAGVRTGDVVVVGHSGVWIVAHPQTGRPIAAAFQGGEWWQLQPGGHWTMEVDANGRVREPGSTAVSSTTLPTRPFSRPHPGAAEAAPGARTGTRAVAGGLAIIVVANEILGGIGKVQQIQRYNIEIRKARLNFWIQFGANPTWEIRGQNSKEVQPFTSDPSTSILGEPTYHYVSEIDIDAFRRTISASIGTYRDLLLWLDMAKTLEAVSIDPPMPRVPDKEDRRTPRRYLAFVDGPVGQSRRVYDITSTIEEIEGRTLAQLDADVRAQVRGLSDEERGNIFRLKSGSETALYRSAHGQRIPTAQHLLGMDPWVRPAGRSVGGGAWSWFRRGHYSSRVLVVPANIDAQRSAEVSAYQINQEIDDVLEEVQQGGRPITDRQPRDGPLNSFVAGPAADDPRFGETRYYRHQQQPNMYTVAIGQLNQFWVDGDELEPVETQDVQRYMEGTPAQ